MRRVGSVVVSKSSASPSSVCAARAAKRLCVGMGWVRTLSTLWVVTQCSSLFLGSETLTRRRGEHAYLGEASACRASRARKHSTGSVGAVSGQTRPTSAMTGGKCSFSRYYTYYIILIKYLY